MKILTIIALLCCVPYSAQALDRYYGSNGQYVGSSTTVGKTTIYYDHNGRYSGTRVRSGIINDAARRRK